LFWRVSHTTGVTRAMNSETTKGNSQPAYIEIAYLLLRVVSGLIFFQAGSMKFLGWFGGLPGSGTAAPLWSQMGIGGMMEFFGGLLVMAGALTRPVAFILSGEMAIAYWQFHAPGGRWPILNHGEQAVLFCFIFLYFAARGAGPWSIDGLIRRTRRR
jgi:putative oxidoreductase